MNIYLANEELVVLDDGVIQQLSGEPGQPNQKIYSRNTLIPITLTPEDKHNQEKVTKLEKLLNESSSSQAGGSKRKRVVEKGAGSRVISIDMAIYTPTPNGSRGISGAPISSNLKGFLRVRDTVSGGILERLRQVYGPGEVKLTVELATFFRSKNTNIRVTEEDLIYLSPLKSYGVEKSGCDVDDGASVEDKWKKTKPSSSCDWVAYVTIIAVVPDDWEAFELSMTDKSYIYKKILLKQVYTDATIISKNGVHVKCHKAFLAGHSSVLATMFQTSSMQESQIGTTVEMPDLSEAGVQAFLAYLYYWEVKEAAKNSLICFELFAAGHKYDICTLKNSMEKILLAKNSKWYNVDLAMKLFLFSRKLQNGDKLKMKAAQVLKSTFSDFSKSPSYHQLFKDDLEAAKDLCTCAFSV